MSVTLLYECVAAEGCPASETLTTQGIYYWDSTSDAAAADVTPAWLTRDFWRMTRYSGSIVSELTAVNAWEYYDWAPAMEQDVVYIGDELYECISEYLCGSVLPYEDFSKTIWISKDGVLGEVLELEDSNAVDAPPLWLYAEYSDYVALDSSDYFQFGGAVYQCNEYSVSLGNCAEAIYNI